MHSSITLALLCFCVYRYALPLAAFVVDAALSVGSMIFLYHTYVRVHMQRSWCIYEDCCLMITYEYWCCWCFCTYRVVLYDPSSVLATAAVVNRRSISLPRCIAPSSYLSPSPCVLFLTKWKTSAVSTTDWMVETQRCKLRGTSDTFVGRAYFIIILRSIEKRLLWARPIGCRNSTLRAAYSIIHYIEHMLEVSRLFFLLRLLHQYYMCVRGLTAACCCF